MRTHGSACWTGDESDIGDHRNPRDADLRENHGRYAERYLSQQNRCHDQFPDTIQFPQYSARCLQPHPYRASGRLQIDKDPAAQMSRIHGEIRPFRSHPRDTARIPGKPHLRQSGHLHIQFPLHHNLTGILLTNHIF